MKKDILLSIAQFEDLYSEWEDYKLKMIGEDSLAVFSKDGREQYTTKEASELLTDFKSVLKKNSLMISSKKSKQVEIAPYIYEFEVDYEELADNIERNLSGKISNLKITTGKNDRPMVRFQYISNLTSGEKEKIKKTVEELVDKMSN